MQFNSIEFMLFFPIVLAVYFIIPRKIRLYWLLVSSYYFYMSWNARYAVLIGASTVITYLGGILIQRASSSGVNGRFKKLALVLCICLNLGILVLFKYGNFFIESLDSLLRALNISTIDRRFDLLLPVGISFYTFQALGYIIDVYRGDVEAENDFFRYALFVSFFPQLVAGPIERSGNLLSQMKGIDRINLWDSKRVVSGSILMVWGFFMKMVIADRVSIIVDNIFNNYRMFGRTELIIAAICFALQIYCDFGSYSMIAIGAAKILGLDLMENFKAPYFSSDIREFWSKWHISLSTWFRDYLYIPLGGNRKGKRRKAVNLLTVFLVSGLWHGANWTYVVWGLIHGIYQVVGNVIRPCREKIETRIGIRTDCFSYRLLKILVTFSLVVFGWIFFRADSITDALVYIQRIIVKPTPWILINGSITNLGLDGYELNVLVVAVILLFIIDYVREKKGMMIDEFLLLQNIWFEWAVVIGLVMAIITYGEYGPAFDAKQFIYFQF